MFDKWNLFKHEFQKNYEDNLEHDMRFRIFKDNVRAIENHNARYRNDLETYELGINQFSDLSHNEYLNITMNGDDEMG